MPHVKFEGRADFRAFWKHPPAFSFSIPEDDTHVRMLLVTTRQFLRYNPLGWLADQFNRVIVGEDARLEARQAGVVALQAKDQRHALSAHLLAEGAVGQRRRAEIGVQGRDELGLDEAE